MIRATFFGIEIARTGINVSQKGLDVTGHNIANVDTAGYTRQRLVNTAYEPYSNITQFRPVENGLVGSGARIMILDQIRDQFLDRQYRTENTLYSYWSTRTQGLSYLESQFEGSEDVTLSQSIANLFAAFNTETTEANDQAQRVLIQKQAINLAQNFNLVYERLLEQQESQNTAVDLLTNRINTIAQSLAELNKSIHNYESYQHQPANDLRDKRNLLIDELAGYVDIEYYEDADGKFIVTIGDEATPGSGDNQLVNHLTVRSLECQAVPNAIPELAADASRDVYQVRWSGGPALDIQGGKLKAHIDLRDSTSDGMPGIPYFIEKINNMVRALAQEINAVHSQGWTHPGSGAPSHQGVNFFEVPAGGIGDITAGNFKIDQDILDNVYNIASSSGRIVLDPSDPALDPSDPAYDPTVLQAGNQENAKEIYRILDLKDIMVGSVGIGTIPGYMTGILLDVSKTKETSGMMLDTQNSNRMSADTARTSISGVSLDEEMTNMIRYQHAFAGASRILTAMDEALETVISKMGLVGRA